jgi:hypothetical protein
MDDMTQFERLSPVAKCAWKRIESEFPMWIACLDIRDGEMECAVPAPSGSKADHLVIFSHEDKCHRCWRGSKTSAAEIGDLNYWSLFVQTRRTSL